MSSEINMAELLPVFLTEADEQIAVLDAALINLEKEGADPEFVREIFRAAHTLKGSSAAMGFTHLAGLTHAMETVFDAVRQGNLVPTDEIVDCLLAALDTLKAMRQAIDDSGTDQVDLPCAELVATLNAIASGDAAAQAFAPEAGAVPDDMPPAVATQGAGKVWQLGVRFIESCEMPAVRAFMVLNELAGLGTIVSSDPPMEAIQDGKAGRELLVVIQSEAIPEELRRAASAVSEVESARVVDEQPAAAADPALGSQTVAAGLAPSATPPPSPEPAKAASTAPARSVIADAARGASGRGNTQTVRVSVEKLDILMNLVGELVIDRTRVSRIAGLLDEERGDEFTKDLMETSLHLGRVIGEVQEEIMKARMLPIDQVFMRFPRMVRDLAKKAGKEVDFRVEGGETELDRSVIEAIVDPLTHLLRNSVDHGIEHPDERERLGKPRIGCVTIRAHHEENQIIVDVEDDGKGIDADRVRDKAVRKGLVGADAAAAMSPREALQLIFLSGLSTAEQVSDVSGRGVGMDIVNSNIQRLGGSVDLKTTVGEGTRFTVRLPLTLAIIRGLLVRHSGDTYIIPLGSVAETLRVAASDIQYVNGHATLLHRGSVLPLVTLGQVFRSEAGPERRERCFVVVARYGQSRVGIIVDDLVGEQEIVIKPLDGLVGEARGLAGASILGNGQVALILDVPAFAGEAGDRTVAASAMLAA